ncbi:hypothetical protein MIMGU_mgv1a005212mg [Erythranthe guttata]|uniref:Uncharacterized protein n=1 Tax=Erythranthe guttata TaxID=4155 RepID=A0A022R150_ERYGU|nr:hypothetical protein MIMGU_mgv1a005212mg [Erythranthe guttata]
MEAVESANPVIGKITCGSLLQQLQQIWDEVGEADEERDKMILQLEQECLDLYKRKVDKAVKSRAQLLQTLADARVELADLLLAFGEKNCVGIPENTSGTIKEQLAVIAPALEKLWKLKDDRIKEFADIQSRIHEIRTEIDGTNEQVESPLVDESDLSTKKLDKFHAELENLQKEKNERLHKVLEFVSSARNLCAVLGADFFTTVTEVHPSLNDNRGVQLISISNDTLSRLDKAVSALQEDKKTRLQKIQELATRLIDLWNLTDTPAENRSLFDLVTCNLSASVDEVIVPGALAKDLIEHARVEVERLSQLKAGRTKELAAKRQAELRKMFADARIEIDTKPARETIRSPIDAGNVEPAEFSADIDDQIVKENGEFSNGKDILDNVEKLMSACKEEICEDDYDMNDKFDTREDLMTWVRQVSKRHGMVLTTKASNNGNGRRRRPYIILVCERGGNYYPKFGVGGKRKRASSSKKCGCPFELKASGHPSGTERTG